MRKLPRCDISEEGLKLLRTQSHWGLNQDVWDGYKLASRGLVEWMACATCLWTPMSVGLMLDTYSPHWNVKVTCRVDLIDCAFYSARLIISLNRELIFVFECFASNISYPQSWRAVTIIVRGVVFNNRS